MSCRSASRDPAYSCSPLQHSSPRESSCQELIWGHTASPEWPFQGPLYKLPLYSLLYSQRSLFSLISLKVLSALPVIRRLFSDCFPPSDFTFSVSPTLVWDPIPMINPLFQYLWLFFLSVHIFWIMFPKVRILLFQLICYVEAVSSIPVSNSVLFFFWWVYKVYWMDCCCCWFV